MNEIGNRLRASGGDNIDDTNDEEEQQTLFRDSEMAAIDMAQSTRKLLDPPKVGIGGLRHAMLDNDYSQIANAGVAFETAGEDVPDVVNGGPVALTLTAGACELSRSPKAAECLSSPSS